jgi:Ca2+/H+ antiporter
MKRTTITEWIECLKDPNRKTWLRIQPKHERWAFTALDTIIMVILVLCVVYTVSILFQLRSLTKMIEYRQNLEIQKLERQNSGEGSWT